MFAACGGSLCPLLSMETILWSSPTLFQLTGSICGMALPKDKTAFQQIWRTACLLTEPGDALSSMWRKSKQLIGSLGEKHSKLHRTFPAEMIRILPGSGTKSSRCCPAVSSRLQLPASLACCSSLSEPRPEPCCFLLCRRGLRWCVYWLQQQTDPQVL